MPTRSLGRTTLRWMRFAAVLYVVFVTQAEPSVAAPVGLSVRFPTGNVDWSQAGFTAVAGTGVNSPNNFDGFISPFNWFLGCACNQSLFTAGFAQITAGPLVSATVRSPLPDEVTRYDFGPGELRIEMEWTESGVPQTGAFVASIPSLWFDVLVFEAIPGVWVSDTYNFGDLRVGPGLFDASLAGFLGVGRQTLGGWFLLSADSSTSFDPRPEEERFLFFHESRLDIGTVPEPATLALLLVGAVGLSGRLRRRRP